MQERRSRVRARVCVCERDVEDDGMDSEVMSGSRDNECGLQK
jgi:hypothetical protein